MLAVQVQWIHTSCFFKHFSGPDTYGAIDFRLVPSLPKNKAHEEL